MLLKESLIEDLDTTSGLRKALQTAVMLEHSTIPPYLFALYSLKPGENREIAELISTVVSEEMAHMALACNILNAIGGEPVIDKPGFVPTYPGPLPGAVEAELTVPLRAFSPELAEEVFMVIEQPDDPIKPAEEAVSPLTIGRFYGAISKKIEAAGQSIFSDRKGRQVHGGIALEEVVPVKTVKDAVAAIEVIVEQGEGTTTSPVDPNDNELAHYYRFAEIVHGKTLEPAPGKDPPWAYSGPAIPFKPAGVWPVIENPTPGDFPPGSAARYAFDTFNYTYTALLKTLHDTFNGSPDRLNAAVGLMESLNGQAQKLMAMESGTPGKNAAPSFEYQPTNP
jgi:rubrerythrin